jgi:hypothetical protein
MTASRIASSSGQRTSFKAVAMTGAWPKNR